MSPDDRAAPAGYHEALEGCAWRDESSRGLIAVSGRDAVSFLHNILTNDVDSLRPGQARYAAYLTPQGRMIADMDVIRREGDVLLAVEPGVAAEMAERLDRSLFTEDVRIEDRSAGWSSLALHGPRGGQALAAAMQAPPGAFESLAGDAHVDVGGIIVLRDDRLGTAAWRAIATREGCERIASRLDTAGVPALGDDAFTALRIEAGIALFGVDMTTTTIPLEAGIEDRAISMTKGCYVGQEVIVRILHRGHGRVARRLVGLVIDGTNVPASGTPLFTGGANAGAITSAAWSPRLSQPVAMGYLSREAAVAGNTVGVGSPEGSVARVTSFPLVGRG